MNPLPFLLISIQTPHAERIFSGCKRFELRKRLPKEQFGKVFLYETGTGKITGYFEPGQPICQPIEDLWIMVGESASPKERFFKYFSRASKGCAIPILATKKFLTPLEIEEFKQNSNFHPPQSWILIRQGSSIFKTLEHKLFRDNLPRDVTLHRIHRSDRSHYISLVTDEIASKYDEITEDFAKAILRSHQTGMDPNGLFTLKKEVLSIKTSAGVRIGFTTLTYKIGGCVKSGPTILLPRYRGMGYGLAARRAIESYAAKRDIRKLYCTCPDNDPKICRHLIRSGFFVEAHLKNHYSISHGEFVFGKFLNKNLIPPQSDFSGPKLMTQKERRGPIVAKDSVSFLRNAFVSYWQIDSERLSQGIFRNAQDPRICYEQKPVDFICLEKGSRIIGAAVFVRKRGGSVKVLWFPTSPSRDFHDMIQVIESFARRMLRRKIYFVHPYDDIEVILHLKSTGYEIEGILKEPYSRGRDAVIVSRFIA